MHNNKKQHKTNQPTGKISVDNKNLSAHNNLNLEETLEYRRFIKESVSDGSYFNDARDWYMFRYVKPVSDRSMLFFVILLIFFIFYLIKSMLDVAYPAGHNRLKLPIVIKQPIFINSFNRSEYSINMVPLKTANNPQSQLTTDETVIQYFVKFFIKNYEEFDYSSGNLSLVNHKLDLIRNTSSYQVYANFQKMMDKSYPDSPMQYLGKTYAKTINIIDFEFLQEDKKSILKGLAKNIVDRILIYVKPEVPDTALVTIQENIRFADELGRIKNSSKIFVIKAKFNYTPISKYDKKFNFLITKYEKFTKK